MSEPNEVKRGGSPSAYKEKVAPENTEGQRVALWHARIEVAQAELHFPEREEAARRVNSYLTGSPQTAKKRNQPKTRIYLGRLEPALQDLFRQTMPGMPTPNVKARNQFGEGMVERAKRFLATKFDIDGDALEDVIEDIQWDDSRYAAYVLKAEWVITQEDAHQPERIADEVMVLQVERATLENIDPGNAEIGEDDVDPVHLQYHAEALEAMPPESDQYVALDMHQLLHETRMDIITKEGARLKRLPTLWYVYDPAVKWKNRGWEAELEAVRLQELFEGDYHNLNPQNLPEEAHLAYRSQKLGWEDMTARVWHIHDIRNNRQLAIAADGPVEGRFLRDNPWPFNPNIDIYRLGRFRKMDADCTYGLATAVLALPILDELASVEYHIQRHAKRHANYKTIFPSGVDSRRVKEDMTNDDKEYVTAAPEIIAGVKEIKPPPIPPALLERRTQLEDSLRRIIGSDAQDTGADRSGGVITATESARRGISSDSRINDRQKIIARDLSWYALTLLRLHKDFATMTTAVKTMGPAGVAYEDVDPREFPDSFAAIVDVQSETDQAKALSVENTNEVFDKVLASQVPVDYGKLVEWYLEEHGEPDLYERIRLPIPEGPENADAQPGRAGTPNEQPGGGPAVIPFTKPNEAKNFAPDPQKQAQGA